jgi:hypothetical protein
LCIKDSQKVTVEILIGLIFHTLITSTDYFNELFPKFKTINIKDEMNGREGWREGGRIDGWMEGGREEEEKKKKKKKKKRMITFHNFVHRQK